jgi:hypothetical protein
MSPGLIIAEALRQKLDIIGISDHNSTRHCGLAAKLACEAGLCVLSGAEVTSAEEVHCLVFFEKSEILEEFQELLDQNLPSVRNVPSLFGEQLQVNEKEEIVYTEEKMLLNATTITLGELEKWVHARNGIFIPAHIDRMKNSIYSQLGLLPEDLNADALEISANCNREKFTREHPGIEKFTLINGSDAHFPQQIGRSGFMISAEEPVFDELLKALAHREGRKVISL